MSGSAPPPPEGIHATAVVIGEAGVLIRGASGAGKSTLARELLRQAELAGRFARLVGDDRVRVTPRNGRLVAEAHPDIAGLIEIRGLGIVSMPYETAAVVRLVVDCEAEPPTRLPMDDVATVAGVTLPRIRVNSPLGTGMVLYRLVDVVTAS